MKFIGQARIFICTSKMEFSLIYRIAPYNREYGFLIELNRNVKVSIFFNKTRRR